MPDKMNKEDCLLVLWTMADKVGRLPKKSDFTESEIARIKSLYGPWPRALEAAGLMPAKAEERLMKNREKRARAKQKLTETVKKAE